MFQADYCLKHFKLVLSGAGPAVPGSAADTAPSQPHPPVKPAGGGAGSCSQARKEGKESPLRHLTENISSTVDIYYTFKWTCANRNTEIIMLLNSMECKKYICAL